VGPLKRLGLTLAMAGAFSLAAAAQQPQGTPAQTPIFGASTHVVPLFVTVLDADKRLVPDLTQDDFEILDNDKLQTIALFDNQPQPISVVVMLDTSGSMTGSIALLKQAAEQFVLRLLPEDKGRVGAFNDKIEFGSGFTSNRDELVGSIHDLDFGNGTRLWDAVAASLDELRSLDGRKVVLVFTDGDDTSSRAGLGDVIDQARKDDAMVYAIGLESTFFDGQRTVRSKPSSGLKKLADETGGGYFELKKTADLAPTFTRVAQELHSQYALAFSPAALDGKVHKLTVRVKQAGMTARARRTYLAVPDAGDKH
jgi:Ca-activated chloride channel family protein